jgi:signal transduction histidine kinase
LGLAISKAYIESSRRKNMGKSEEGNGSTFYFTLPYKYIITPLEKESNLEK